MRNLARHGSTYLQKTRNTSLGGRARLASLGPTHPNPGWSPDGTKIVFNSDMLGDVAFPDVFAVVVRRPDAPVSVNLTGARLSWAQPRRAREPAGYRVYRKNASGTWTSLAGLTRGTVLDLGPAPASGEIAVSAVEFSGLESPLAAWSPDRIALGRGIRRLERPGRRALLLPRERGDSDGAGVRAGPVHRIAPAGAFLGASRLAGARVRWAGEDARSGNRLPEAGRLSPAHLRLS